MKVRRRRRKDRMEGWLDRIRKKDKDGRIMRKDKVGWIRLDKDGWIKRRLDGAVA